MKYAATVAAILAISALTHTQALAFGREGHELVCEIGYGELTGNARKAVDEILDAETNDAFSTFRASCTWPDSSGALQQSRRDDHYVNVPRNWTAIFREKCALADDCLFTAIRSDIEILRDPLASKRQKLEALKFLGHWVGDIHQPLHTSYEDDQGGNHVLVSPDIGCTPKLHAVWDTCIPRQLMADAKSKSTEDFGKALRAQISADTRAKATASTSPLEWANESLLITRQGNVGYCFMTGANTCTYAKDQDKYVYDREADNEGKRTLEVDSNYEATFMPIVKERIQLAGIRLGALLNQILDTQ